MNITGKLIGFLTISFYSVRIRSVDENQRGFHPGTQGTLLGCVSGLSVKRTPPHAVMWPSFELSPPSAAMSLSGSGCSSIKSRGRDGLDNPESTFRPMS